MGRRSSSTKAGKSINPTDQARKEARKRELKKNKKQRLLVREAVLKNRDPKNLLTEMEAIDKMEYDVNNPPPYNVKVLQEKRNKLRATWNRMIRLYEKDDVKLFNELKHLEIEYDNRRAQMMTLYESIKQAEKVKVDEIPLPEAIPPPPASAPTSSLLPTMPHQQPQASDKHLQSASPKSILKPKPESAVKKKPPGPPAGIPPSLIEFEGDEKEAEKDTKATLAEEKKDKSKKIRFIDESASAAPVPLASHYPPFPTPSAHPLRPPMGFPPGPPPPPPTRAPLMPPGAYPSGPPPPNIMSQYPRMQVPPPPPPSQVRYMPPPLNTFSAPPTRSGAPSAPQSSVSMGESATTIEAKPVLRNKMAELTRFVPSSLVVRRDQKPRQANKADPFLSYLPQQATSNLPAFTPKQTQPARQETLKQAKPSTDAAYEAFMKEMNKIL